MASGHYDQVISGMRQTCDVHVYIDIDAAISGMAE